MYSPLLMWKLTMFCESNPEHATILRVGYFSLSLRCPLLLVVGAAISTLNPQM